jgi:hypothetical protein
MKTTTLNRIRAHRPCTSGWKKLLAHLGKTEADDEPLPYQTILDSNGWRDAVWCMRVEPQFDKDWRLFAVWCARRVQHLMRDPRSITTLDVAERFAKGEATEQERAAAYADAYAAAAHAAAAHAARAAAYAAAAAAAAHAAYARAAYAAANADYAAADANAEELKQVFAQ